MGKMTPKSFLHSLQFFSEALGYCTDAVRCRRTRKLVDVYAKPTKAKSQAPMFTVETMDYLVYPRVIALGRPGEDPLWKRGVDPT